MEEFYKASINRFAETGEGMVFCNRSIQEGIVTVSAMLKHSKQDMYVYEQSLDGFMYCNDEYLSAMQEFINRGKKIFIIVRNAKFSEEFIKLYKAFGFNITVKQADEEFMTMTASLLNGGKFLDHFYCSGKMFRVNTKNKESDSNTFSTNSFDEDKNSGELIGIHNNFFKKLKTVDVSIDKKPSLDVFLTKFEHLNLQEKDLISIFEFLQ